MEHAESQIDDMKRSIESNLKGKDKKEVKCLCVHGKCRDGESECYKCDQGWTGKLCDIKKDTSNINSQEEDTKSRLFNKKQGKSNGSRMERDRSQSDYEYDHKDRS